ncbi:MAG: urea carboxylase-associated family protein, partial [Pseudomonadota bacterium]|nr:urea carboxylase-associated family protein [Pseudomonadota bacterium]
EVPAAPGDADARRAVEPVIVYPNGTLAPPDLGLYRSARAGASKTGEVLVQPREGGCFHVPAGGFFRISSVEGPQVGDLNLWNAQNLNLWNAHNLDERFYSGKTRAIHGTHITTGERMWSNLPYLRPMATIIEDTLGWYGIDGFGGGIHDVIGTRCDPYTHHLLAGDHYHHCCHSNLS